MSPEREGLVTATDLSDWHVDGDTVAMGLSDRFLDPDGLANPLMRSACGYVSWLDFPVDDGDDA